MLTCSTPGTGRWRCAGEGTFFPTRLQQGPACHTAVVEKRLGHALAILKAQQDLRLATKVMTNSEKTALQEVRM